MLVPQRVKTAPPLECYWKAHDAPVVSVEYIQHTSGDFVLSASTDKTARLWTPEGHYVGTFGQVRIDVSINSFTAVMLFENHPYKSAKFETLNLFLFLFFVFALACEKNFIKTYRI